MTPTTPMLRTPQPKAINSFGSGDPTPAVETATKLNPRQESVPVPGGMILISRDDTTKITLYEIEIPRRQLALFDPDSGRCRFGFMLYNSELPGGPLDWSDIAGVFDYWKTPGSFPPTWRGHTACQTFFGIEK